jgi:hypothetical protein
MIWLLLACSSADPELVAQRRALDAWTIGRDALEAGDAPGALTAFDTALEHQPDDPILLSWKARALAADDRPAEAADLLARVVNGAPRFVEARYNRAAYLARTGALDEAGIELARAIDGGAARSRQAMVDPDFAPHLEHPAFAFLPDEMLIVALDAPRDALFWGSVATVRLRVIGAEGAPATVEAAELSGPLELVGASEDVVASTEGLVRDLTWELKVRGAGEAVLGPFEVQSAGFSTTVRAVRFPTNAPPGKDVPEGLPPLDLTTPSALAGALEAPGLRYDDAHVDVLVPAGARATVSPSSGPPVVYTLLERSKPVWTLERHRFTGERPKVAIRQGGEVLVEGP